MLSVIPISDSVLWDRTVKSFRRCDVSYLSGYADAFRLHGDGEPLLFYYQDQGFRAVNAVIKRDISKSESFYGKLEQDRYFDLITPYGYGGFLLESETGYADIPEQDVLRKFLKGLDAEYTTYCEKNSIVSELARFHPILRNHEQMSALYDVEERGRTVFVDLSSSESIWMNLSGKNRNMVRKAQQSGIRIYWGRNPELFRQFSSLYHAAMVKKSADSYYFFEESFYNSILYGLRNNSLIFYAMYQEKIIAAAIILYGNGLMHYFLSASDEQFKHLAPTNLLLYEAACWGSAWGCRLFHLGGGLHSREDSLYHFKKSFSSGSDAVYATGNKCFLRAEYDRLTAIRIAENKSFDLKSSFFPLYRQ